MGLYIPTPHEYSVFNETAFTPGDGPIQQDVSGPWTFPGNFYQTGVMEAEKNHVVVGKLSAPRV